MGLTDDTSRIFNNPDIPETLKQSLGIASKITESIQPVLQQQAILDSLTGSMGMDIRPIEFSHPVIAAVVPQIPIPAMHLSEFYSGYQLNSGVLAAIETMNDTALRMTLGSIESAARGWDESILTVVNSPFVEWLNTFDISPLQRIIEILQIDFDEIQRRQKLNKAYLQAMYDCEWFPYAGVTADISLFWEINDILASSRGSSKRRKDRIDKAILVYYTPKELKCMKKAWRSANLEPHIKKILGQAVDAHLRGEYVLSISCLATMWEGLLKAKMPVKARKGDELKSDIKDLVTDNGYDEILGDFYNNLIIRTCYSVDDVKEGVPNRHGVAHSWYKKYPNKKASLNAILLTDFIIGLTPKEQLEEDENK